MDQLVAKQSSDDKNENASLLGQQVSLASEDKGIYAYLWPIHVDVWQKPTHCKAKYPPTKNKTNK